MAETIDFKLSRDSDDENVISETTAREDFLLEEGLELLVAYKNVRDAEIRKLLLASVKLFASYKSFS